MASVSLWAAPSPSGTVHQSKRERNKSRTTKMKGGSSKNLHLFSSRSSFRASRKHQTHVTATSICLCPINGSHFNWIMSSTERHRSCLSNGLLVTNVDLGSGARNRLMWTVTDLSALITSLDILDIFDCILCEVVRGICQSFYKPGRNISNSLLLLLPYSYPLPVLKIEYLSIPCTAVAG